MHMIKYILGALLIAVVVVLGISSVQKNRESNLAAVSTVTNKRQTTLQVRGITSKTTSRVDDTSTLDGNPLSAKEYAEFEAFMAANPELTRIDLKASETGTSLNRESGIVSSNTDSGSGVVTACPCVCPYGKIIIVLGIKSKPGDKDYEWFKSNFPTAELIPLGKSAGDAKIAEIKKKVLDYVNDTKCPKQKLLLIGYSLGAAIVKDLKADCKDCADIIAIDPPYPSRVCTRTLVWISKPFSAQLRQICRGSSADMSDPDDIQVNWTNGNSLSGDHYPWRNLNRQNTERLAALKRMIDQKINDCKAPSN